MMKPVTNKFDNSAQASKAVVSTENVDKMIKKYTLLATGGGVIPVPFLAVSASVAAQVFMIKNLCETYQVDFDENKSTVILNSSLGGILSKAISVAVSAIIPNNQPMAGLDLTGAVISGLYTATVGEYYRLHFEDGGTLEDASLADLGNYFIEEIQNGNLGVSSLTNPTRFLKQLV